MKRLGAVVMFYIVLASVVMVSFASADWPMFRHDSAHIGVGTGNSVFEPTLLWKQNVPNNVTSWSSAAVVDGVVYVCSETFAIGPYGSGVVLLWSDVYAFDAVTGVLLWDVRDNSTTEKTSPAVADGMVFVGSGSNVVAFNATDGVKIWAMPVVGSSVLSSPAVVDGVVYIGGGANTGGVYALNVTTGDVLWVSTVGNFVSESSPAVANGAVYIGGLDYSVYCLNATNGELIWTCITGTRILRSPAVIDNIVYISSYEEINNIVYAIDATSGNMIWSKPVGGSSVSVANGVVYVGSGYDVYALNATSGATVWSSHIGGYGNPTDPVVVSDFVYVVSNDGILYALNASSGAQIWTYKGTEFASSPSIANGVLYVGFYDQLYAFGSYIASSIAPSPTIVPSMPLPSSSVPEFPLQCIGAAIIAITCMAVLGIKRKTCK